MAVVDSIKQLVTRSRLFLSADKIEAASKTQGKRVRGKRAQAVKMGQGGTLDPLADGVLVIGIGQATKRLDQFLGGVKVLASPHGLSLAAVDFTGTPGVSHHRASGL